MFKPTGSRLCYRSSAHIDNIPVKFWESHVHYKYVVDTYWLTIGCRSLDALIDRRPVPRRPAPAEASRIRVWLDGYLTEYGSRGRIIRLVTGQEETCGLMKLQQESGRSFHSVSYGNQPRIQRMADCAEPDVP
jgi:hypothetical protein